MIIDKQVIIDFTIPQVKGGRNILSVEGLERMSQDSIGDIPGNGLTPMDVSVPPAVTIFATSHCPSCPSVLENRL